MRNCIMGVLIILSLSLIACNSGSNAKLLGSWVEPIPGMEGEVQGITLQEDGKASSINMHTLLYKQWESLDSKTIILKGQSVGNGQTIEFSDTLKIEKLDSDSLILNRNDFYTRYVRKQ